MNNREERANTALYQEGYRSGFKGGRQSLLPVIKEAEKELEFASCELYTDSDGIGDIEQAARLIAQVAAKLQSARAEIEGE